DNGQHRDLWCAGQGCAFRTTYLIQWPNAYRVQRETSRSHQMVEAKTTTGVPHSFVVAGPPCEVGAVMKNLIHRGDRLMNYRGDLVEASQLDPASVEAVAGAVSPKGWGAGWYTTDGRRVE